MSDRTIASAISKKIKTQFPDPAEGNLWYAVLKGAILDLNHLSYRTAAIQYLTGDILAAEVCGVDVDWIKRLLLKTELLRDSDFRGPASITNQETSYQKSKNRHFYFKG